MKLLNLTGHVINAYNPENKGFMFTIGESMDFKPIRAERITSRVGNYGRLPIERTEFELTTSLQELRKIKNSCDGVIVSKISAECLKRDYPQLTTYIVGGTRQMDKSTVGIYSLSLYNQGE